MRWDATFMAVALGSLAACRGGGATNGVRDPGDEPSAAAAAACQRVALAAPIPSSGDTARDLFAAYRALGTARIVQEWTLDGVGGAQAMLDVSIEVDEVACTVTAAVITADGGGRSIVQLHVEPDRPHGLVGAFDLAGCEQPIGGRTRFDARIAARLRVMREPAVVTFAGDNLRFWHLHDGVRLAGTWSPPKSSGRGSYSVVAGPTLAQTADGPVVRWGDVYHAPGDTSSPIMHTAEHALELPPDAQQPDAAPSDPLAATRARVASALDVPVAHVGDVGAVLDANLPEHDGWLVALITAPQQLAIGLADALPCGGATVEALRLAGPAVAIEWSTVMPFAGPASVEIGGGDGVLGPPLAGGIPGSNEGAPATLLALVSHDATGARTLHLVDGAGRLVWQRSEPLPTSIELVQGADALPYLLASGRIYRHDGAGYSLAPGD